MKSRAFTLIELLVVIAIIAILAAILFPVFAQAKLAAKKTVDLSNVTQLNLSTMMYLNDNNDTYPFCWGFYSNDPSSGMPWQLATMPYVKNQAIWHSPVDNWGRGVQQAGYYCQQGQPAVPVTYSMNYIDPRAIPGATVWGSSGLSCQMSPTCDDGSGNESAINSVASTILAAPRPNWYHQMCEGWATDDFFNYSEFNMQGGGATMFNNGTNYAFADGHAKFMTKQATLQPQGNQASTPAPANWPANDANNDWPWPVGMWSKQQ